MKTYTLAIIGFGNVGQGLAVILNEKHSLLKTRFGLDIRIVAVCDQRKGSLANPDGLDPQVLLNAIAQDGTLNTLEAPTQRLERRTNPCQQWC